HACKTTLEALQTSQRATSLHVPCPRSYPGRGSARGRANLLVAQGGWRNGRRARFRSVCPKGREGSNPSSPTSRRTLLGGLRPPSRPTAVLARGDDPPEPPGVALSLVVVLAVGQVPAVWRVLAVGLVLAVVFVYGSR